MNGWRPFAGAERETWKSFFLPELQTIPDIESIIDRGRIFAFIIAGAGVAFAAFKILPYEALADSVIFVGLGYGIGRKSRICAVLAAALFGIEKIVHIFSGSRWGLGIVISLLILSIFINAARATFAYHTARCMSGVPDVASRETVEKTAE